MKCQVFNCGQLNENKSSDCSFFNFPKDADLLEKWIKFCQQKNSFNPKTARICMAHFQYDDFENNIQFEMGFAKYRLLKKGVVPTIYSPHTKHITFGDRKNPLKKDITKSLEECSDSKYTENDCAIPDINVAKGKIKTCQPILKENLNANNLNDGFSDMKTENIQNKGDNLRKQNKLLRYANRRCLLQRKAAEKKYNKKIAIQAHQHEVLEKKYLHEIRTLNEELSKTRDEVKNIEEKLSGIFTKGQIKKLKSGNKRKTWLKEDIAQSLTLYATSAKAYKLLYQKGFPLPGVRTLQRWARRVDMARGVAPSFENVGSNNSND